MRSLLGYPRQATTRSKTRVTRSADKPTSIAMANTSRLKSSITLSVLKRRPQNKQQHDRLVEDESDTRSLRSRPPSRRIAGFTAFFNNILQTSCGLG